MRRMFWSMVLLVGVGLLVYAGWLAADLADTPDVRSGPTSSSTGEGERNTSPTPQTPFLPPEVAMRGSGVLPLIDADAQVDATSPDVAVEGRPGLAVVRFRVPAALGAEQSETGEAIASLMLSAINSEKYDRYVRTRLGALLEEARLQESDLIESTSRAVRFGGLKGVRFLVLGELLELGGAYHLRADLADCQTGQVLVSGWVALRGLHELPDRIPELANLLGLRDSTAPVATNTPEQGAIHLGALAGVVATTEPISLRLRTADGRRVYQEGEYIRFVVEAARDCYITLISVDSQGVMTLLLPNRWQSSVYLKAGEQLEIPGDGASYRFPIQPPHGPTLVKAIATPGPLRLSGVTTKSVQQQGFALLDPDVKAVSGDDRSDWATAELAVVTRRSLVGTAAQSRPTGLEALASPRPVDLEPDGDPNERLLAAWRSLVNTHLAPVQDLTGPETIRADGADVRELLIVREDGGRLTMESRAVPPGEVASAIAELEREAGPGAIVLPNLRMQSFGGQARHRLVDTRLGMVQWGLHNEFSPGIDLGWGEVESVDSSKLPLIGLVDGSVAVEDPRLRDAIARNGGETAANGRDDDGNGYIDDVSGYSFIGNSSRLSTAGERFGHGSFVASIIAAQPRGNDADIMGMLPGSKLAVAVALRAGDDVNSQASGDLDAVLRGIEYVAKRGARIINLSVGCPVSREELDRINRMPLWDRLERDGVLLVCAAGNDAVDIDEAPVFPASLPRSNVLAVMACDVAGRPGRWYSQRSGSWRVFSNRGKRTVDLAAPGTLILGIPRTGEVELRSGTSYAAAYATGAAAITWSKMTRPGAQGVISVLMAAARPNESLAGFCRSGAILRIPTDAAIAGR